MKESSVAIAPIQCDGVSGIKLDPLFPWANNNIPPSAVIPEMAFVTVNFENHGYFVSIYSVSDQ